LARPPTRDRDVYFIGAGLSSAFGLPNTPQLLSKALELARSSEYWKRQQLEKRLEAAWKYFYPIEASDKGFLPPVVDFFTVLKTYTKVAQGLPGQLEGGPELLRDLVRSVAHVIVTAHREADEALQRDQEILERLTAPGALVISTNWDLLVERYAQIHDRPLRLRFNRDRKSEATLLKLHGSIDWCSWKDCKRSRTKEEYRRLGDQLFGSHAKARSIDKDDSVVRITALENWGKAWSRLKSRASEPFMLTMAFGKHDELKPLKEIWRDAYLAISRARALNVIGYSLPSDDLEIRTILMAGIRRQTTAHCSIKVQNPSPEVHDRFRNLIERRLNSDYRPVAPS